jgi:hypothetical protein
MMSHLGCELVNFIPNAIATLNCFTMLCGCWLGIEPNTSLFWYFYSPSQYEKVVFFRMRLPLHHHHRKEYIKASFKSNWKGATQRWFLVDMHIQPQWVNMHLLQPLIDKNWGEPK